MYIPVQVSKTKVEKKKCHNKKCVASVDLTLIKRYLGSGSRAITCLEMEIALVGLRIYAKA